QSPLARDGCGWSSRRSRDPGRSVLERLRSWRQRFLSLPPAPSDSGRSCSVPCIEAVHVKVRHPVRRKKIHQNLDATGIDRALAYHAHTSVAGPTPHTLYFSRGWQSASVNGLAPLTFEEVFVHRQSAPRAPALVSSSTSRHAIVMRGRSVSIRISP